MATAPNIVRDVRPAYTTQREEAKRREVGNKSRIACDFHWEARAAQDTPAGPPKIIYDVPSVSRGLSVPFTSASSAEFGPFYLGDRISPEPIWCRGKLNLLPEKTTTEKLNNITYHNDFQSWCWCLETIDEHVLCQSMRSASTSLYDCA